MERIIIFTCAYNAEKTIQRCIDSVINQTFTNFIYYIVNHGSTDNTSKILQKYSEMDRRIYLFNHPQNEGRLTIKYALKAAETMLENGFFCTLDADDEYEPDFFENMLNLADAHNLDVVACGNLFIYNNKERVISQRCLQDDLILEGNSITEYFPVYYQFMRTIWAKFYSLSVIKKCNFTKIPPMFYGTDTAFSLEVFGKAIKIGILAKTLHKYYVSNKSVSYTFDIRRIFSDQLLFQFGLEYLIAHGPISMRNKEFLFAVYYHAIKDSLQVLYQTSNTIDEKLETIIYILSHKFTQELICQETFREQSLFALNIYHWLMRQKIPHNQRNTELIYKILNLLYKEIAYFIPLEYMSFYLVKMPEIIEYLLQKEYQKIFKRLSIWYKRHNPDIVELTSLELSLFLKSEKSDNEILKLLLEIKEKRPCSSKLLDVDSMLCKIKSKNPLLKDIGLVSMFKLRNCIYHILENNFERALEELIVSITAKSFQVIEEEPLLLLGINLSAITEHTDNFILLQKLWFTYLIEHCRGEEILNELEDYIELCPDDKDFPELKNQIKKTIDDGKCNLNLLICTDF